MAFSALVEHMKLNEEKIVDVRHSCRRALLNPKTSATRENTQNGDAGGSLLNSMRRCAVGMTNHDDGATGPLPDLIAQRG